MGDALVPTADPTWRLETCGHDLIRESSLETRFAISNGFLGVRGALAINRDGRWVVPPRTYVAGLFDTPDSDGPASVLVPAADWLQIRISTSDGEGVHRPVSLSGYRSILDMKRGVVLVDCQIQIVPGLAIKVRTLRLVSMAERALGLQLIQLGTEAGNVEVKIEASFGGVDVGLPLLSVKEDVGIWRTRASGKNLAVACASSLQIDGRELQASTPGPFTSTWLWKTTPGQIACLERTVAFRRGDASDVDLVHDSHDSLCRARSKGWRGILTAHVDAWAERWRVSNVEVDSDGAEQQALRFALYHLNGAANPGDDRVSIGARGLTGDDYHGHVFWDTEIYLLPFYIMTWPAAARAMLMYRFHTLSAARGKATAMGWHGALYAWESADTGAETTPSAAVGPDRKILEIRCGAQEQHISADVAYAVWQYWRATGDEEFLREAGAEIILETGRFWASRAQLEKDGLHHIRGIIGPDEYHETVDDNAFTNVMARWNIRRAADVATLIHARWPACWATLSRRLEIDGDDIERWRDISDAMATGLDVTTGIFEQFEGFFALEPIDLSSYEGRTVPMDVVLGRARTARSQVVKQADVVALVALLPDEFAGDSGSINFRYYESRCAHGSSLSRAMHGLAAARLGYADEALAYFDQTSAIDLGDAHVAIAGGLHMAALGGVWQIAVFGFAGLSLLPESIDFRPQLPSSWRGLRFMVNWRGRSLRIHIDRIGQVIVATLESGEPMAFSVCGELHSIDRGHALRVGFRNTDNLK